MTHRLLLAFILTTAHVGPASATDLSTINRFGARLLRTAATHDDQGVTNRMTSPIAESLALGMTAHGAAGDTRERLLANLHLPADLARAGDLHRSCQDRLAFAGDAEDWQPTFSMSQAAWHQVGAPELVFKSDFVESIRRVYSAEVGALDFRNPAAARTVNAWVDQRTEGLIKEIAQPNELRAVDYLMLNVTYFAGSWAREFRLWPPGRRPELNTFTRTDGTVREVPVIAATDDFRVGEGTDETVVELPIESPASAEYAVYAVLPKSANVEPARYWDAKFWATTLDRFRSLPTAHGRVVLPKFAFDYSVTLDQSSPITGALNFDYLFDPTANFTAMSAAGGRLGLIKEVTRIELDEKGVKAAAAVMVGAIAMGVGPEPEFDVRFDRPFAFAIVEKTSGVLLFLGEVQDPQP